MFLGITAQDYMRMACMPANFAGTVAEAVAKILQQDMCRAWGDKPIEVDYASFPFIFMFMALCVSVR